VCNTTPQHSCQVLLLGTMLTLCKHPRELHCNSHHNHQHGAQHNNGNPKHPHRSPAVPPPSKALQNSSALQPAPLLVHLSTLLGVWWLRRRFSQPARLRSNAPRFPIVASNTDTCCCCCCGTSLCCCCCSCTGDSAAVPGVEKEGMGVVSKGVVCWCCCSNSWTSRRAEGSPPGGTALTSKLMRPKTPLRSS
jgi:hypothetical protein